MPRNQVSIEELRCRIMKLKNSAYYDVVSDGKEELGICILENKN